MCLSGLVVYYSYGILVTSNIPPCYLFIYEVNVLFLLLRELYACIGQLRYLYIYLSISIYLNLFIYLTESLFMAADQL